MPNHITSGVAAGAVGSAALNIATYLDMAIRGRPSSQVPSNVVQKLTDKVRVSLQDEGSPGDQASNRRSALGALLGYANGVGIGALYGLIRGRGRSLPLPLAAIGLGISAMAGSDVPATALGVTDPREWSPTSWAADIVPHLAYGWATALAYEAFSRSRSS